MIVRKIAGGRRLKGATITDGWSHRIAKAGRRLNTLLMVDADEEVTGVGRMFTNGRAIACDVAGLRDLLV